jgi:hypothetical protein
VELGQNFSPSELGISDFEVQTKVMSFHKVTERQNPSPNFRIFWSFGMFSFCLDVVGFIRIAKHRPNQGKIFKNRKESMGTKLIRLWFVWLNRCPFRCRLLEVWSNPVIKRQMPMTSLCLQDLANIKTSLKLFIVFSARISTSTWESWKLLPDCSSANNLRSNAINFNLSARVIPLALRPIRRYALIFAPRMTTPCQPST